MGIGENEFEMYLNRMKTANERLREKNERLREEIKELEAVVRSYQLGWNEE